MTGSIRFVAMRGFAVGAIALLAVAINAATMLDASAGQSSRAQQTINAAAAPTVVVSPAVSKRQFARFKAVGTNGQADMTPWEKFCFNIHKDDFTPDGYVACVNGWVE